MVKYYKKHRPDELPAPRATQRAAGLRAAVSFERQLQSDKRPGRKARASPIAGAPGHGSLATGRAGNEFLLLHLSLPWRFLG